MTTDRHPQANGSGQAAPPPYREQVIALVGRALAMLDHNPASRTFGCFDRGFWHYRTLTNFPGATWQQLMWPLAKLHRAERADNPHAGDPALLSAATAGLGWWCHIQKRDGSFDEWYLNEHSYCPTAFTAAAAALTVLELDAVLPAEARRGAAEALRRAAAWLERRFNPEVMNQNLAAALALLATWRVTGEARWRDAASRKYSAIEAAQHAEGWFPEYDGMDFGYSTLALDLLALADTLGEETPVLGMAQRLSGFLMRVKGAGPGYPGRLSSRGTAHVFPFGAEHFADRCLPAAALAAQWREDHRSGILSAPATVDDRYFAYFYFPQFVQAYLHAAPVAPSVARHQESREDVPGAGLVVIRRGETSITVQHHLGGALAVERAARAPCYHLGYEAVLQDGRRFVTAQWAHAVEPPPADDPHRGTAIRSQARFTRVADGLPLVRWAALFHLFTGLLRWSPLAALFQRQVKAKMIRARKSLPLQLVRHVDVSDSMVSVTDTLSVEGPMPGIGRLLPAETVPVHSPSARQDAGERLPQMELDPVTAASRLMHEGVLVLHWSHRFDRPASEER